MLVPEIDDLSGAGPQVWNVLQGMLRGPSEIDFVRRVIGENVIDANEIAHTELMSLLTILSELRSSRSSSPQPQGSPSRALRPLGASFQAADKGLLVQRLQQLLEQVTEPVDIVFRTPREQMIAEYVSTGGRPQARPVSRASSTFSHSTTKSSVDSRPTSAGSSQRADPSQELGSLKRKLRFDCIHEVSAELLSLFQSEKEAILADIDTVRELIEGAMSWSRFAPPTQAELKEMSKKAEESVTQKDYENSLNARMPTVSGARKGRLGSLPPAVSPSATPPTTPP